MKQKQKSSENENSFILSVDLKPFRPIPGVTPIVGDIRSRDVHDQIWEIMNGEQFDLIISDIHPGRSSSSGMDHNFTKKNVCYFGDPKLKT